MLQRSILKDLADWKSRRHHPLIIRGLRQCGKTFIVREFAKANYPNVVYLDLRANTEVHRAFEGDFSVDNMVMAITALQRDAHFVPGQTLLILDEIQDCPSARSSLKYWDLDGRYDVIATGSFLGVQGFRDPYSRGIPVDYEEDLVMFPLSFQEFLRNSGMSEEVMQYASTCLQEGTPVNSDVHEALRSLYYQYLIVGGMPEAVNTFLAVHDLNAVQRIQRQILHSIRDDFGRYKNSKGEDCVNETLKLRAEACLNSLPAQLSKEYKKFQYSLVDVKGKSKEKADGLQYLIDVGLAIKACNVNEISVPLEGHKIASQFKVYYTDPGLLVSQLDPGTPAQILSGNLSAYKGAIAENMVADAFLQNGRPLYYYHAPSGSPELDFVYEEKGQTVLVECKSTNNRATSMKFVLSQPKRFGVRPAVKFADSNVRTTGAYKTYPLYALGFLPKPEEPFIVPEVNVKGLKVGR